MGLLDELKKQSAEKDATERLAQETNRQRNQRYQADIKPKLEQIYRYLFDLSEHLNELKPDTRASYLLPLDLSMDDLLQQDYVVSADSSEQIKNVVLRCNCMGDGEIIFSTEQKTDFFRMKEFLFSSRLKFKLRQFKDERHDVIGGEAVIEQKVPIQFEFSADVENSCINLSITNLERIGTRKLVISPDKIDDQFLDDLGHYLLRESSDFMTLELPDSHRKALAEKIAREKREREQEIAAAEQRHRENAEHAREGKLSFKVQNQLKNIYRKYRKKTPPPAKRSDH